MNGNEKRETTYHLLNSYERAVVRTLNAVIDHINNAETQKRVIHDFHHGVTPNMTHYEYPQM